MSKGRAAKQKGCSIAPCEKAAHGRGYCRSHYMSWWRHGDASWIDCNRVHAETGSTKHPLYSLYRGMISRCYSSGNPKYSRYGARGIKVCDRWLEPLTIGFWNFVDDMGVRPPGYTLDRLDVDGDYSAENCRWASQFAQQSNRSNNRKHIGVRQTASGSWEAKAMAHGIEYQKNFGTLEEAVAQRNEWENEYGY